MFIVRPLVFVFALGLLGAAPAVETLPALLVPRVHGGEQLRYLNVAGAHRSVCTLTIASVSLASISWTVPTDDSASKDAFVQYTQTSDGVVVNSKTGNPSGTPTLAYDVGVFGRPPQVLDVGTHWSNTVYDGDWIDFWSVKVADIQPKPGVVRLHLELVRRQPATEASYYEAQDGDITFVNGIMTNFSLSGYFTTTFDEVAPYHRQDLSYSPNTLMNGFRISRRTTLLSTVP